jgi:hypothetical protein
MERYNKKCNNNFTTSLNDKYNITFYSDDDNKKFIILKHNDKYIWAKYKIICSYNLNKNILKKASDMIIIEKSILDTKINFKEYKTIDDIENNIMDKILDYYIGYVIKKDNNMIYFIGIEKIIRF